MIASGLFVEIRRFIVTNKSHQLRCTYISLLPFFIIYFPAFSLCLFLTFSPSFLFSPFTILVSSHIFHFSFAAIKISKWKKNRNEFLGQITISNQIVVIERARESINLNVIAQQQQQQQKTGFIESKIILVRQKK